MACSPIWFNDLLPKGSKKSSNASWNSNLNQFFFALSLQNEFRRLLHSSSKMRCNKWWTIRANYEYWMHTKRCYANQQNVSVWNKQCPINTCSRKCARFRGNFDSTIKPKFIQHIRGITYSTNKHALKINLLLSCIARRRPFVLGLRGWAGCVFFSVLFNFYFGTPVFLLWLLA